MDKLRELIIHSVCLNWGQRSIYATYWSWGCHVSYGMRTCATVEIRYRWGDQRKWAIHERIYTNGYTVKKEYCLFCRDHTPGYSEEVILLPDDALERAQKLVADINHSLPVIVKFVNEYVIPHLYKPPNGRMFLKEMEKVKNLNK